MKSLTSLEAVSSPPHFFEPGNSTLTDCTLNRVDKTVWPLCAPFFQETPQLLLYLAPTISEIQRHNKRGKQTEISLKLEFRKAADNIHSSDIIKSYNNISVSCCLVSIKSSDCIFPRNLGTQVFKTHLNQK